MSQETVIKLLVVAVVIVVAFVAFMLARRIIAPVDGVVTRSMCTTYGREVLSRELIDSEASNRFSLIDRRFGECSFGPIVEFDEEGQVVEPAEAGETSEDAAPAVDTRGLVVSIADIETPGTYRGAKWLFVILQLGAASAVVRALLDPLLNMFVRRPKGKRQRAQSRA